MEIDKWTSGYKVRAFPWIDGKQIYFNVQYYMPGSSLAQPPAWDKTVYVTDDEAGRRLAYEFTDTLANHVAMMNIKPNTEVVLTVS